MSEKSEISGLQVVCPSTVGAGEPFTIGLKVVIEPSVAGFSCRGNEKYNLSRRYDLSGGGTSDMRYLENVPRAWDGTITLESEGDGYHGPAKHSFEGTRPCGRVGGLSFSEPGLKFVTARDSTTGLTARSNPILVSERQPEEKLFWGDIHCHTWLSDGLRSPEQVCAFARDETFLDIFGIADHNGGPTPRQWDYCVGVSNDFNEPGRFVTLIGQEWGGGRSPGHLNVYYPASTGSELSHRLPGNYQAFLQDARKHRALVIHHHSATAFFEKDWGEEYDPELHRLVEIYSVWGDSERPESVGNPRPVRALGGERDGQHVIDALKRGYRFGFIAGSDCHDGRPGAELHTLQEHMKQFDYHKLYRQGIMGVWATELTREAVFQALYERRTFATTGERVILRFSANGHPMGAEVSSGPDLEIRVEACSAVPVSQLALVGESGEVASTAPNGCEVRWEQQIALSDTDERWIYVRLTREDEEMAWSSPIWVSRRQPLTPVPSPLSK